MSAASKVKDVAKKVKGKAGGAGRDAKGRFKTSDGAAAGDPHLPAEGTAGQVIGKAKKTAGKAGVATQGVAKRAAAGTKKKAKPAAK
ncbi:uncharacterized protein YjbJ (UPF0337 family) [Catenulispora sp. GAS73]|uniref:hypothetical protein n=1 Tax=Catenulispora sp. GAS73 TaxID=3156269 RepID=UPI0035181A69